MYRSLRSRVMEESTQAQEMKRSVYIARAEAALEATKYKCDNPSQFLLCALSYLSDIPGSRMSLEDYNYLYFTTDISEIQKATDEAWAKLNELKQSQVMQRA